MVFVRSGMRALMVVAAIATYGASPAKANETRRFGDWVVACTDADICKARTGEHNHLTIQRHRLADNWEIQIELDVPGDDPLDTLAVQVDDLIEQFEGHGEFGQYGTTANYYLLADKAKDVFVAMLDGRTTRFAFEGTGESRVVVEHSLVGLRASLLWIDEQQGRVGNARSAGAPPYGLLPFGPGVDTAVAVPNNLVQHHRGQEDCKALEDLSSGRDSIVAALDDEATLAVLPCSDAAYNSGAAVYVIRGSDVVRENFAEYSDAQSWFSSSELMNVRFDRTVRALTTLNKDRGPGDCGSAGRWLWTADGFRLEEFRYQAACDGTVEPGAFPVIFTAKPQTD